MAGGETRPDRGNDATLRFAGVQLSARARYDAVRYRGTEGAEHEEARGMSYRTVHEVEWARRCERPACIPRARVRGTAARGLSYERGLARALKPALPGVQYGPWYSYKADGATGYCQPDFVYVEHAACYVLECKLTNVEEATEQLLDLYFPVLRRAHSRPVRGVIVARSVHRAPALAHIAHSLSEAMEISEFRVPVLHWLGRGALT